MKEGDKLVIIECHDKLVVYPDGVHLKGIGLNLQFSQEKKYFLKKKN